MASINELSPGDYVRWRAQEGYEFGTVNEINPTSLGTVEAYITPDGAPEGVQVSKLVNDLVRISMPGE